jgi:NAD(P)-dependent dehydrogenase (short-subunit alcohol dehydrogenase family)
MNPVLITGCAGFIGMHCAKRLLEQGVPVVGIDNLNNYYDVALKHARLAELRPHAHFRFVELDLADRQGMADLFAEAAPAKFCTWPRRPVCATPSISPTTTPTRICWALAISCKAAASTRSSIWSMPAAPASMAATPRCRLPKAMRWTTPSATTQPPRRPMS